MKEKKQQLRAVWEHDQKVLLYRGDMLIANVCQVPVEGGWRMGWKVFPLSTLHTTSRKGHNYPSDAIRSMYGVNIQIQAKGGK